MHLTPGVHRGGGRDSYSDSEDQEEARQWAGARCGKCARVRCARVKYSFLDYSLECSLQDEYSLLEYSWP